MVKIAVAGGTGRASLRIQIAFANPADIYPQKLPRKS